MAERHEPRAAHPEAPVDTPVVHHEESDVDIRAILMFGGVLVVVVLAISGVVGGVFRYFDVRESHHQEQPVFPLAAQQESRLPPEPRLQTNPREEMRDLRAQEEALLTTYGWADRNAGTVRIPIDQAMKLAIQRGLPTRRQGQNNEPR